jgi:hypothetical protein
VISDFTPDATVAESADTSVGMKTQAATSKTIFRILLPAPQ